MYVYCAYVYGAYVLHVGISPIKWLEETLAKTKRLTIRINKNKTQNKLKQIAVKTSTDFVGI